MTIYLITLVAALNHVAFVGARVAVALYALHLGASNAVVGILVAFIALCPAVLSIGIGKFADRARPRVLMMAGTVGLAASMILQPLFPGIAVLYFSTLMLGFWNQVCNIPLEAIAGGVGGIDRRARNYAVLGLGLSAATFLGPVVAGLAIDYIGYGEAFAVLALFTVPTLVILWFVRDMLPESMHHASESPRGSVLDLWRIAPLRTTMIAAAVNVSAWDLFQFFMPIYGHSIGLSASAIGTIIGMVSVATFAIRAVIPFLIKHMTEARLLSCAILAAAVAFLLLPFFTSPYALGAIAFLLGLGFGCGQPISQSMAYVLTPKGRIAESTGLRKTVNQAIHMTVPMFFGSVGGVFGFLPLCVANALALAACAAVVRNAKFKID